MQFIRSIDLKIFYTLNNLTGHSAFADFIIVFFASYLAYILPVIFIFLVLRSVHMPKEKISLILVVFLSAAVSLSITELVRFFYHRPRPFLARGIHSLFTDASYSFPSAHASFFFAFAFSIYLYNKKWGIWFIVATVFMTVGRIIAGVHYPSDIFAGFILGIIVAYFVYDGFKNPIEKIVEKFLKNTQ